MGDGDFRRLRVDEVSDDSDDGGAQLPRPAGSGWQRLDIAEVSDDERPPAEESEEPSLELRVEATVEGIARAKDKGSQLYAQGAVHECVRWLSKCLWLADAGRTEGIPANLHSILHSNRALAHLRLEDWAAAAEDASAALRLNKANFKARYRRSVALLELGKFDDALLDAQCSVKGLPDERSRDEARKLEANIREKMREPDDKDGSAQEIMEGPKDKYVLGDFVVIFGLTSAAGQSLNGQTGQVMKAKDPTSGRYGVRLPGAARAEKLLREENLQAGLAKLFDLCPEAKVLNTGKGVDGQGIGEIDVAGMDEDMKAGFMAMKANQEGGGAGSGAGTGTPKGGIEMVEELEHLMGKGVGKCGKEDMMEGLSGMMGGKGGNDGCPSQ